MNRTNATIVRSMDIAHFQTGTLAGETARAKCRKGAQVFHFGENILLIHNLRQLVGSKKCLESGLKWSWTDKVNGQSGTGIDGRHSILDVAAHLHHSDFQLLLEHLADIANAPKTQVIDVIGDGVLVIIESNNVTSNCY